LRRPFAFPGTNAVAALARGTNSQSRTLWEQSLTRMKPIEFLQGKWLGHPLHPALVHLPIGAWCTACALDVINRYGPQSEVPARLALYFVGAGLVMALLAVPTGIADWTGIKKENPAWKIGIWHMVINALAALVWCGNFGLRLHRLDSSEPITEAVLLTSATGTLLLLLSGYLGKLMVFDRGISVARESKKKWRAIAARGGARLPPPK
jgi:uncharacterized membrane protein